MWCPLGVRLWCACASLVCVRDVRAYVRARAYAACGGGRGGDAQLVYLGGSLAQLSPQFLLVLCMLHCIRVPAPPAHHARTEAATRTIIRVGTILKL